MQISINDIMFLSKFQFQLHSISVALLYPVQLIGGTKVYFNSSPLYRGQNPGERSKDTLSSPFGGDWGYELSMLKVD